MPGSGPATVEQATRATIVGFPPRPRVPAALPAVGAYAVARLVGLGVLALLAEREGRPLRHLLTGWDGYWYIGIATDGYDTSVNYTGDQVVNTNIAFFPLFPWLIRVVSLTGLAPGIAGVVIAHLAGLAAAWGIALVGTRVAGARVGLLLAVLWGVLPHAVVQSMAYSESLCTALCAWALWAVLERRFVLAGALTALAGLTRPTAAALIAAVMVAGVVAVARHWREAGGWRGVWANGGWRPWLAIVLAPVGLLGYLAWCAAALGRADAYTWMQAEGWGQRIDAGYTTVHELAVSATRPRPLALSVTGLVILASVVLYAILARRSVRDRTAGRAGGMLPLLVFSGLLLLTVLIQGGDYYYAKARLLLPAFPLLLPVAATLAATNRWVRAGVLAVLCGFSAWFGGYLLLTWHLSP